MGYEKMGRLCISGFVWISVDHYNDEGYHNALLAPLSNELIEIPTLREVLRSPERQREEPEKR